MRWGKTVLVFQAITTLIIGMAFFIQVMQLDSYKISQLNVELKKGVSFGEKSAESEIVDLKERYSFASYILLIIGLMELMIISRLLS
jgi:hypothetical protein